MPTPRIALIALVVALLAAPAHAEQSQRSGDITVHYNALPSTTLTAEVARSYGLTRSSNRALVNIAVRRAAPGQDATGNDHAESATVRVHASNLAGQRQALTMREVREGEAIYYLGEARVTAPDTLRFEVEVEVVGQPPVRLQFRQEFFPD